MELEQQCVSLGLAKKLKELGIEQKSLFYIDEQDQEITYGAFTIPTFPGHTYISTFTVAELGEMLPEMSCVTWKTKYGYACREDSLTNGGDIFFEEETEADARAKTLIYLIENGLLKA